LEEQFRAFGPQSVIGEAKAGVVSGVSGA
jgi:hypothetical protein